MDRKQWLARLMRRGMTKGTHPNETEDIWQTEVPGVRPGGPPVNSPGRQPRVAGQQLLASPGRGGRSTESGEPILLESELDTALREVFQPGVPSSIASQVRIVVAAEARQESTRRREGRRPKDSAGVLAFAIVGVVVFSMTIHPWLKRESHMNTARTARNDAGSPAARQILATEPRVKEVDRMTNTISLRSKLDESQRGTDRRQKPIAVPVALWIDEPSDMTAIDSTASITEEVVPRNSTGRVVVTDELRGVRTTYEMTRETGDGGGTQVAVTFQQEDLRAQREEKTSHASS